jgi:serine/threonine protein kinase
MLDPTSSSNGPSVPATSGIERSDTSHLTLATISPCGPSAGAQSIVKRFEDYEIESETTLSGFGGRRLTVCRAQDGTRFVIKEGLHRPSAKMLSVDCDCDHPSVVTYCEVFRPEQSEFLLRELFQANGSLGNFLCSLFQGDRPLFWFPSRITEEALRIGFALLFLHSRGLFHGSLNPSHILFDEDHHLRLDFSSSLHFRKDRCFDGVSFCIRYQAPEIEGGGEVHSWTDVYSFGVLLSELFTRPS